jgi:hypothetical protein
MLGGQLGFHLPCSARLPPGVRTGDLVIQDLEQAIRERAYGLWIESGCPNGNAEEALACSPARSFERLPRHIRARLG